MTPNRPSSAPRRAPSRRRPVARRRGRPVVRGKGTRKVGSTAGYGALLVAVLMVVCSGMVNGTMASYTASTTGLSNWTDGTVATPTSFANTISGPDFDLSWASQTNTTGFTVGYMDNGSTNSCTSVTYNETASVTGTSDTFVPSGAVAGHHYCLELTADYDSWTSASSDVISAAQQYGMVADTLALAGTAGKTVAGDTISVTFNQAEAAPLQTSLTTALTTTPNTTSLKVDALPFSVASGNSIVVQSGSNSETFSASATANVGATSISVTSKAATFAFPVGSIVYDSTQSKGQVCAYGVSSSLTALLIGDTVNGCSAVTDGYDVGAIEIATSLAATGKYTTSTFTDSGDVLTVTLAGGSSESLGSSSAAAYFYPSSVVPQPTSTAASGATGVCSGDNTTLTTALSTSGSTTSLAVAGTTAQVPSGSGVIVTSGTHTQTFTANGATAAGATSIAVTSATANYAYPVGSTVTDQYTANCDPSTTTDF